MGDGHFSPASESMVYTHVLLILYPYSTYPCRGYTHVIHLYILNVGKVT